MRLRRSDPQVRAHGQFKQGRQRRTDRGEQQGHGASRSSANWPKVVPARTVLRCRSNGGDLAAKYPTDRGFRATDCDGPFVLTRSVGTSSREASIDAARTPVELGALHGTVPDVSRETSRGPSLRSRVS